MIIGIDMGGTNIDGVILSDGIIVRYLKHPVDKENPFRSIWNSIKELLIGIEKNKIRRIQLSTTVSTNAIVENRISKVGVILQRGPGMKWQFDDIGKHVVDVSGSVDHRGLLVQAENTAEILRAKEDFIHEGIDAVAAIGKFSTRNPDFEQRTKALLEDHFTNITMGHKLSGKLNFPRRVKTAYLNAAVHSTFRTFAENLQEALERENVYAPIFVLKADGGTMSLQAAMDSPVETILSGPAASLMGMTALLNADSTDRCLLDIGGTTTDIFFLIDGVPVFEPSGIEIAGKKTLVRAVYSTSIGLGGDSYVKIQNGEIKIGPERMDHAIAFGGKYLTPTDALLCLENMDVGNRYASAKALEKMAAELGVSPQKLAESIINKFCNAIAEKINSALVTINSSPVYTIKELLNDRCIKPQSLGVIGGPAMIMTKYLEKSLNMPVECPPDYAVANAIGAALARPTLEANLFADTDRKILSISEFDIYEEIDKSYNLDLAKSRVLKELDLAAKSMGYVSDEAEAEVVEANSFNMIKGYGGREKNIRVKAQIRPGLIKEYRKAGKS